MTGQTRRGLAPPMTTQKRFSALIPSLWVINALLVGVVILAPASKQASTSPVDNVSCIPKTTHGGAVGHCPAQLANYVDGDIGEMKAVGELVSALPPGVSNVYALQSQSRVVAHLEGDSSGGTLMIKLDKGSYQGQWVDPTSRRAVSETIVVDGDITEVGCPAFSGAVILDIQSAK